MAHNFYLGIDVGSVTTKLAVIDEQGEYVDRHNVKNFR